MYKIYRISWVWFTNCGKILTSDIRKGGKINSEFLDKKKRLWFFLTEVNIWKMPKCSHIIKDFMSSIDVIYQGNHCNWWELKPHTGPLWRGSMALDKTYKGSSSMTLLNRVSSCRFGHYCKTTVKKQLTTWRIVNRLS